MSEVFRRMFTTLLVGGNLCRPRGQATYEVEAYRAKFLSDDDVWCTLPSRKLSLSYVCAEFLWYLRADPQDTSITERAAIWKSLAAQGKLQSNYGVYLFREGQFMRCVNELKNDPDSRRASVIILRPEHYVANSADIPCTYSLNFRIRNGALNMSVHMRSNDAWFGAGNDCPIFRWTQHMMAIMLGVRVGEYIHMVDSMHLYQRHWLSAEQCTREFAERVYHPPIENPLGLIRSEMTGGLTITSDFHEWLKETANAQAE